MVNSDYLSIQTDTEYKPPLPPEYALWCSVLETAIDDLSCSPGSLNSSFRWFLSDRDDIGSFLWICLHLDLSPYAIIKRLAPLLTNHLKKL